MLLKIANKVPDNRNWLCLNSNFTKYFVDHGLIKDEELIRRVELGHFAIAKCRNKRHLGNIMRYKYPEYITKSLDVYEFIKKLPGGPKVEFVFTTKYAETYYLKMKDPIDFYFLEDMLHSKSFKRDILADPESENSYNLVWYVSCLHKHLYNWEKHKKLIKFICKCMFDSPNSTQFMNMYKPVIQRINCDVKQNKYATACDEVMKLLSLGSKI